MTTSWPDARRIVRETGARHRTPAERLAVADAQGRTLASPVAAELSLPPFDRSAMDGWAVAGPPPWSVGSEIVAGDPPPALPLSDGECRPISTGAALPTGAVAVLRRERGRIESGRLHPLAPDDAPAPGRDIRRRGEEATVGEMLLRAGEVLNPAALALAAVAGHDVLDVAREPVADILVLGDEIVGSGIPGPGRVRDAFSPSLPGLLGLLGARTGTLRQCGDDEDRAVADLRASRGDLTVTTAGTSRGERDHLRGALARIGCEVLVDAVAMRPGHPVIVALRSDGRPILALPGNPFAAMVCLLTLGVDLIGGMLGRPVGEKQVVRAAEAFPNARPGTRIVAVTLAGGAASPARRQEAGMLRGLAGAHALAVIPPSGVDAGEELELVPLPWR